MTAQSFGLQSGSTPGWFIGLRASSMAGWFDCSRRNAVRTLANVRTYQNKTLKELFPDIRTERKLGIGASVGTSAHVMYTESLLAKIKGQPLTIDQAIELGRKEFAKLAANGNMEWDQTTGNADTANIQLEKIGRVLEPVLRNIDPELVEHRQEAWIDKQKGYKFTGSFDALEKNGTIRDAKFGRTLSQYEAQLGTYSLMSKSHGIDVKGLAVDWVKRTARTKPQAEPITVEYNVHTAENAAVKTAEIIMDQIEKFKQTGDPWSFPANNSSMLCSAQWCDAWGTSFCDLGKQKHETQGDW